MNQLAALADLVVSGAQRWPGNDALVFPGERWTYARLLERTVEIAQALVAFGVQPGGHVAVMMANSPEFIACALGASMAGAVIVPINTRYRTVELPHVIRDAKVQVLLTSARTDTHVNFRVLIRDAFPGLESLDEAGSVPSAPDLRTVVVFGADSGAGFVGEADFLSGARKDPAIELERRQRQLCADDPAIILYTSGTTSQPSGCVLTNATLLRSWRIVGEQVGIGPGEKCWAPAPLFHITGLGPLLFCLGVGATFVSDTYFDASRALDLIDSLRPEVLWPAYPPIIKALSATPGFNAAAALAQTRLMLAVAPPETMQVMQLEFGHVRLISLYGSTETTVPTLTRPDDAAVRRLSSCGQVIAPGVELRVRDLGSSLDAIEGATGEIMVRGFTMFQAYYGNPAKTQAAFDADGWFHTGDLGSLDDCGCLTFAGRLKEMLKVGGENVAPAEVEAHLSTHPAVKLVQVVGLPDERLGEVVAAFVELAPGAAATEAELIAHCTGRLARYKVPRHVRFTSDWPMSASKIRKAPLVERLLAERCASAGLP